MLNRRIRRTLRSSAARNLFNENSQLVQNVTGSKKSDSRLIRNVPAVYESIETERNNYLPQPDWLNETRVRQLAQITSSLDKLYYTNEAINQLQVGELLKEIRINLIENSLKLPNTELKLGYLYVVGSDQFSALLNALDIYERRPKFSSSFVIELDDQQNIRLNFFDAAKRTLDEKHISCDKQEDGCKLVPFLKKIDQLIPISLSKSCVLPRPRLIQPDYDSLLDQLNPDDAERPGGNKTDDEQPGDDEDGTSEEDDEDDGSTDDDSDLRRLQRRCRRRRNIRKFLEKQFDEMLRRNRELLSWLSDLFERKLEERRTRGRGARRPYDSEDDLRARLVEILREKATQAGDPKQREKLNALLSKWQGVVEKAKEKQEERRDKMKSIIESHEDKLKEALRQKDLLKQKQRDQLLRLVDKIEQFTSRTSLQRAQRLEEFQQKINRTIKDAEVRFNEKLDAVREGVQELLEDKFNQIKNNFNEQKMAAILQDVQNKFTSLMEESKLKRDKRLKAIRDAMNRLVEDGDLLESEKAEQLNEVRTNISSKLDQEEISEGSRRKNDYYSEVNQLIESLPNAGAMDSATEQSVNDEQLKVEKIKDKLKSIETKIINYLEKNKDNKKQINEDLAKLNAFLQSHKAVSVGVLTRLARAIDNEEIREEIKEVIKRVINFAQENSHNLLIVQPDLTSLVNEVEEANRNVSSQQLDLDKFESSLNISRPAKLLKAENPTPEETPAFSPRVFGITVAIVAGTLALVALTCLVYRRVQRRKNYTRV